VFPSAIFAPIIEHGDAVGDIHDHAHVVLDQQDGDAELVAQHLDESRCLGSLARIHPGGRLVEQQ
jgi:hypothetical protein